MQAHLPLRFHIRVPIVAAAVQSVTASARNAAACGKSPGGWRNGPDQVAIYTSVSAVSKSRHGEAVAFDQRSELQEEPLRNLAERRGWVITRVYRDRLTGVNGKRPQLDDLLADVQEKEI